MTFDGKWRITAMDLWDQAALDLVVPAYLQIDEGGLGEFQFIAVRGGLDCKYSQRAGRPLVEFTWEGEDDGERQCGHGWAVLQEDGSLEGHFFFHLGDDSAFTAVRLTMGKEAVSPRNAAAPRSGGDRSAC